MKTIKEKLSNTFAELRTSVSYLDFIHLTNFIDSCSIKGARRSEIIQNRKLERLKREYLSEGIDPDKVIFNYSSYELNDIEKKVLSRGLKFCIQPDELDYCQSLTPFEKLIISMNKLMEWPWALRWGRVLLIYLCVLLNKTFFLTVHLTKNPYFIVDLWMILFAFFKIVLKLNVFLLI